MVVRVSFLHGAIRARKYYLNDSRQGTRAALAAKAGVQRPLSRSFFKRRSITIEKAVAALLC